MFLTLIALATAAVEEVTTKNADQYIGGPKPVLVKFYSPNCGHCKAMAPDFEEASTYFTDATFAEVNCMNEKKLCDKHKIDGYPTLVFFDAGKTEPVEFDGDRTADSFADFIEAHSVAKSKRPPRHLKELDPLTFDAFNSSQKCGFVIFYAPWCGHCKRFLPEVKKAAYAFSEEPLAKIGAVNCDKYKELCNAHDVHGFPTVKMFVDGELITYDEGRTVEGITHFVNKNCGTFRAPDGLLNGLAGLVPAADELVHKFVASPSEELVEEARKIEGAEFYVKMMERYLKNGPETVEKDRNSIANILREQKVSHKVLDNLKIRYNIIKQFTIHEEAAATEDAAPSEEAAPAAEEAPKEL